MNRLLVNSCLVSFLLILVGCAAPQVDAPDYGTTRFQVSGNADAQAAFKRGLLMLHNFEYEDARQAFVSAEHLDPDLVMAFWGEALSYDHPLWGQQDLESSRAALNKIGATPEERIAKAVTDREKAYVSAVNQLFGEGDDQQRADQYRDAMEVVAGAYPDDADAAALYALSILATSRAGRDEATYLRAGAVTDEILKRFPNHPGALHYNIHSYDDPAHAERALDAANRYADIAPAAIHSLHMPAHIYFALGMFDKASALNTRSWNAAVARMEKQDLAPNGQAYHSLSWLVYSLIQEGRIAEAEQRMAIIREHAALEDNLLTRTAFILMRSEFVSDTGRWDSELLQTSVDYNGLQAYAVAADRYVRGVSAVEAGDLASADKFLAEFPVANDTESLNPRYGATEVSRLMLAAWISRTNGDKAAAYDLVQQAVTREHGMEPSSGPPVPVKPAAELLGDMYLADAQLAEAVAAYDLALTRRVGRRQSVEPRDHAKAQLALGSLYNRAEPFSGITTAGQPDADSLHALADLGYTAVIDLRGETEDRGLDEKTVVQELGMQYVSIPVSGSEGISFNNAQELDHVLAKVKGPVLVHCGSSNRVGALFALRAKLAGSSVDEALAIGRSAGLKSLEPVVVERLNAH